MNNDMCYEIAKLGIITNHNVDVTVDHLNTVFRALKMTNAKIGLSFIFIFGIGWVLTNKIERQSKEIKKLKKQVEDLQASQDERDITEDFLK